MELAPHCQKNVFAHCYGDIRESSDSQIRLFFHFEQNKVCVSSIMKFDFHGDHLILAEIVNISHHEIHNFFENQYRIGYKSWSYQSNYDI